MAHKSRRKAAAAQAASRQNQPKSSRRRRAKRSRSLVLLWVALGTVVIAVFVYYAVASNSGGAAGGKASAALGALTDNIPPSPTGSFTRVGSPLRQDRKPVLLFIGAEYCPYCAAERWAIVKAMSRFGSWSGLTTGQSTSGAGGFGDLQTFDLLHAGYHSRYVAIDHKDIADNASATLQTLTSSEQALFNRYDPSGGIPMVYVDGYSMLGAGYSPTEIQGLSFSAIAAALKRHSSSGYVADINGEANLLTAFLCKADGGRPMSVCAAPVIAKMQSKIK